MRTWLAACILLLGLAACSGEDVPEVPEAPSEEFAAPTPVISLDSDRRSSWETETG